MADSTNKFKNAIQRKGGGFCAVRKIDSTTFLPQVGAKWVVLGYLKATAVNIEEEGQTDEKDERGLLVASISGDDTFQLETQLMQRDRDSILIGRNYKDILVQCYYYGNITDGKHQEYLAPVCRVVPKVKADYDAAKTTIIPVTVKGLAQVTANIKYPDMPAYIAPTDATLTSPSSYVSNLANSVIWESYANKQNYSGQAGTAQVVVPNYYAGTKSDQFNQPSTQWGEFGKLFELFETPIS